MLHSETDVDASTLQNIVGEAHVPRRHLENVQEVVGHILIRHRLVHDFTQGLHLQLPCTIVPRCKPLLLQDFLVQEALVLGQLFEAVRDTLVSITDDEYQEVVFLDPVAFIGPETVVVVDEAAQGRLQLTNMLVIHSDADCEGRRPLPDAKASLVDFRKQACLLDVAGPAIGAEAGTAYLRIELALGEDQSLIGGLRRRLPLFLVECHSRIHRLVRVVITLRYVFLEADVALTGVTLVVLLCRVLHKRHFHSWLRVRRPRQGIIRGSPPGLHRVQPREPRRLLKSRLI